MTARRVRDIEDFRFSATYYAEVRAALARAKARRLPDHTEDDEADFVEAILDLAGMLGHRGFVMLDAAALQLTLSTATLRSAFVGMGRLVSYNLAPAAPATTDLIFTLLGPRTTPAQVAPAGATFVAIGEDGAEVLFSTDAAVTTSATAAAFGAHLTAVGDLASLSHVPAPVSSLTVFGSSAAPRDCYVYHPDQLFDELVIEGGDTVEGGFRVEYSDGIREVSPDAVVDVGGSIEIDVSTAAGQVLGTFPVVVRCLRTNETAEGVAVVSGGAMILTVSGTMGQSTVSEEPGDYLVRTEWATPDDLEITVEGGTTTVISFTLPETAERTWERRELFGGTSGFWLRLRRATTPPASPTTATGLLVRRGDVYCKATVRQGVSSPVTIGTTDDGSAGQSFDLPASAVFGLESLTVDGTAWTEVASLLASSTFDPHYVVREAPDGTVSVLFGDGQRGRIPPASVDVVATVRTGSGANGNVGGGAVRRVRTAIGPVARVRNPRAATGWRAREGDTEADRIALRERIPATVRANDRIVTSEDAETFAQGFVTTDGRRPVERAIATEGAAGTSTIRVLCVGPGGAAVSDADLEALDEAANGARIGIVRRGGRAMFGTLVTFARYTPRAVAITATISVDHRYEAGALAAASASLQAALRPLARRLVVRDDGSIGEGSSYQWEPNSDLRRAVLLSRLGMQVPGFLDVAWTTPAADVELDLDELPTAGTLTLTISAVAA